MRFLRKYLCVPFIRIIMYFIKIIRLRKFVPCRPCEKVCASYFFFFFFLVSGLKPQIKAATCQTVLRCTQIRWLNCSTSASGLITSVFSLSNCLDGFPRHTLCTNLHGTVCSIFKLAVNHCTLLSLEHKDGFSEGVILALLKYIIQKNLYT